MSVTSAIVMFATLWFLTMFVTLPIGLRTQGDDKKITPGTQASVPNNFRLKRTLLIVTGVTIVVWTILFLIITSGIITVEDIDWRGVMSEK